MNNQFLIEYLTVTPYGFVGWPIGSRYDILIATGATVFGINTYSDVLAAVMEISWDDNNIGNPAASRLLCRKVNTNTTMTIDANSVFAIVR